MRLLELLAGKLPGKLAARYGELNCRTATVVQGKCGWSSGGQTSTQWAANMLLEEHTNGHRDIDPGKG